MADAFNLFASIQRRPRLWIFAGLVVCAVAGHAGALGMSLATDRWVRIGSFFAMFFGGLGIVLFGRLGARWFTGGAIERAAWLALWLFLGSHVAGLVILGPRPEAAMLALAIGLAAGAWTIYRAS